MNVTRRFICACLITMICLISCISSELTERNFSGFRDFSFFQSKGVTVPDFFCIFLEPEPALLNVEIARQDDGEFLLSVSIAEIGSPDEDTCIPDSIGCPVDFDGLNLDKCMVKRVLPQRFLTSEEITLVLDTFKRVRTVISQGSCFLIPFDEGVTSSCHFVWDTEEFLGDTCQDNTPELFNQDRRAIVDLLHILAQNTMDQM